MAQFCSKKAKPWQKNDIKIKKKPKHTKMTPYNRCKAGTKQS